LARYLGIGKETTFGTAVAPTKYIAIVSENIALDKSILLSEDIQSRQVSRWREGTEKVVGGWRYYPHYEDIGEVLLGLLGSVATTQPDATNAPNTYQHIFTPGDTIPTWTVEVGLDSVTAKQAVGVAVEALRLALRPDSLLDVDVRVLGKSLGIATLGSPSFGSLAPIAFSDVSSMFVAGSAASLIEFELNVANNINDGVFVLGSRQLDRVEVGYIEVAGRFSLAFDNTTQMNKFLSGDESSLQVKIEGSVIESTYKYTLQIDLGRIVYNAAEEFIDRRERIIENVEFIALKPANDDILKFTLINTETGY